MLSLTAALALASGAVAADTMLRWKFKPGETLNYVMDRKVDGKMDLSGSLIEFQMGMTFDTTWNVKSVAADGTAQLEQTVDRVQMSMDSPLGGALNYDSKKPGSGEGPVWQQMGPMIESMVGQTFSMNVTPAGKVTDITMPEKVAAQFEKQKAGSGGPGGGRRGGGLGGMGGNMFSEAGIKELLERSVLPLPDKALASDTTWSQHFEQSMMGAGVQKTEIKFSPAGKDKADGHQVEKIMAKTELTFEPAENAPVDIEIAEQEGETTFYFDVDAGRTLKVEGKQKTVLEITAPNREITQEIQETVTVKQGKSPEPSADDKPAK